MLGYEIKYKRNRVTFEKVFCNEFKVTRARAWPITALPKIWEKSKRIIITFIVIVKCKERKENLHKYRRKEEMKIRCYKQYFTASAFWKFVTL